MPACCRFPYPTLPPSTSSVFLSLSFSHRRSVSLLHTAAAAHLINTALVLNCLLQRLLLTFPSISCQVHLIDGAAPLARQIRTDKSIRGGPVGEESSIHLFASTSGDDRCPLLCWCREERKEGIHTCETDRRLAKTHAGAWPLQFWWYMWFQNRLMLNSEHSNIKKKMLNSNKTVCPSVLLCFVYEKNTLVPHTFSWVVVRAPVLFVTAVEQKVSE